jgi:ketosteroid isomerase-like protein
MKTNIKIGLLMFLFVSSVIGCKTNNTGPVKVIDSEQIKKEIQEKENEFASIYNSGELKNIGYYAEDAISFSQNSPPMVGRTAIVKYLKDNVDSLSKNKISFKTIDVFVSSDGNQVVETGYYQVVDTDSNIINTGNYMSLFVKRDGKYVSLRDMSASDMK